VTNVRVGDRVTYTGFLNTLGAYSTERLIPAAPLIKLPETISFETAAAMTMRGLTSAYLMRRIYDFKAGDSILLHAAAGGVGLIVCVGTASGPIPAFDPVQLAIKGSLFMTRPALADYIADPAEKAALAGELFDHVGSGRIKIEINQHYALQDAAQAHRDLESR